LGISKVMSIIGHEKIISYFDRVISADNVAQAYCFVGPDEAGKNAVANYIAGKLLRTIADRLKTHPDYIVVQREEDEKTGKLKKDITVKQARDLRERLQRKSWMNGYKIAVIDEAEKLNEESGNALLKILEDAGPKTVFFLLTTDDNALLPTVRSRSQIFYLALTPVDKIAKGLLERGIDPKVANEAANLSWGRPGRALRLAMDAEAKEEYNNELSRWENIIGQPFHVKLKEVEDLFKDKEDTGRVREALIEKLGIWMMIWREILLARIGVPRRRLTASNALGDKITSRPFEIAGIIEKFKQARVLARQNINPRLVVENILISVI